MRHTLALTTKELASGWERGGPSAAGQRSLDDSPPGWKVRWAGVQSTCRPAVGLRAKTQQIRGRQTAAQGWVPTSLLLGHMEILKANRLARLKDEYEYSWNGTYEKRQNKGERDIRGSIFSWKQADAKYWRKRPGLWVFLPVLSQQFLLSVY